MLHDLKIVYEEEEFDISLFNRPWVSMFTPGKKITIMGRYDGGNRITAISYNFQPLQEQMGTFPVYNLKDGITQKDIRKYIEKAPDALSK